MANLIRLRPDQTEWTIISHPLLNDVETFDPEELDALAAKAKQDPAYREQLYMALLMCVKNTVGRFLHYWEDSKRFEDDMVGEGFSVLTELVNDPPTENVFSVTCTRVRDRIELFLNRNVAMSAPGLWKQKQLTGNGDNPLYVGNVDLNDIAEDPTFDAGDELKRDLLDSLAMLQTKDEVDEAILDPFNWGRRLVPFAEELGVSKTTLQRRKKKLFKQLQEIMR